MAKRKPVRMRVPDWAIGLVLTGLACGLWYARPESLEGLELKAYDFRMKLAGAHRPTERIVLVAIDDESIAKLGRWPWPRARVAQVIDQLGKSGAKVIGLSLLFSEPEENSGLLAVEALEKAFAELNVGPKGAPFLQRLAEVKADLNNDAKLIAAVQGAGNVVLPVAFTIGSRPPGAAAEAAVPAPVAKSAFNAVDTGGQDPASLPAYRADGILFPLPELSAAAAALGHVNRFPDRDGVGRWEALVVAYGGEFFPSFALEVAARYLGIPPEKMALFFGQGIDLGGAFVPTDPRMRALINYYGPDGTFPRYSFYDVLNGKIAPSAFRGKVVLIGATAAGLSDVEPTPLSPVFAGAEKQATVVANLLEGSFLGRPDWAPQAELAAVVLIGLFTAFLLPRLGAGLGSLVSAGALALWVGGTLYLFLARGLWLGLTYPVLLLVANYMAITSRRFLVVEKEKKIVEVESDEANKLLGLTFQGKGMLDLAFEKFQRLPVDDEMKGVLYNLAMDFERKRMAGKALAVYDRISGADPKYKDVGERIGRLKVASALGAGPAVGRAAEATMVGEGIERPTLGRYEILEELGRGAMGVVYKGRDPKINRLVAIKTVHFDQIEEAMVPQVKERFFREAQSAGSLSHPNILTIYDVGEELDLAYIAMELIEGKTLEASCKKGNLLPWGRALEVGAQVCDGLAYAHQHGIVHRDIKPANIMVLKTGEVKVTDFGIARIQSASQTRTGAVLGTPSYMAPEQVAGQKVDGRADLFSLGVVLYELLTAERPFAGDSIATIMFQITSAPHPPLTRHAPGIPAAVQGVIDRALAKDAAARFQTAAEFGAALRQARASLPAGA